MNKKYDSVIIGHITLDYNTDHLGTTETRCGGAVLYSSAAGFGTGHKVCAVTSINPKDRAYLSSFTLPSEDVFCIERQHTTVMKNHYLTADKEKRDSVCAQKGDPISLADLPDTDSPLYHLAGLVVGDFSERLITDLSKKGKLAVDVQGFLRNVSELDGKMYFSDWKNKKAYLPFIDYLKTDAFEAEVLTGLTDRREAAKALFDFGAKEILITHNTEVLVYDGRSFYTCPIRARNLSGRTGRGDTTTAVYTLERNASSIDKALLFATAAVSLKMETPGVFSGTRSDVEDYISAFYRDFL